MKLAAIYNVWDGVELLHGSMQSVADGVDVFIIVYQTVSNSGELFDPKPWIADAIRKLSITHPNTTCAWHEYKPNMFRNPGQHERNKRNIGLTIARDYECTHFLHMDCDEYYMDFVQLKSKYIASGSWKSVCNIHSYFKLPTLRLENLDNYFVPFIHLLRDDTIAGNTSQREYGAYVDPTRTINGLNTNDAPPVIGTMHHFTWIRNDIMRKVRNSTAVNNIMKSNLIDDYNSPFTSKGTILKDYNNQKLISVPDHFNILEMIQG
jgi:hypothetical protein